MASLFEKFKAYFSEPEEAFSEQNYPLGPHVDPNIRRKPEGEFPINEVPQNFYDQEFLREMYVPALPPEEVSGLSALDKVYFMVKVNDLKADALKGDTTALELILRNQNKSEPTDLPGKAAYFLRYDPDIIEYLRTKNRYIPPSIMLKEDLPFYRSERIHNWTKG